LTVKEAEMKNWKSARVLPVLILAVSGLAAQQVEITPFIGGQINGGVDYSTRNYTRADLGNALTYGFAAGYSLTDIVQLEFQWNRSDTDVSGTPVGGGPPAKVFRVAANQFSGNVLFHLAGKEEQLKPFLLIGGGAGVFSPDAPGTNSLTRPVLGFGGGVKYFVTKNIGLRVQMRWLPINMYSSQSGTWCGPITGCWSMGSEHYLHSLEFTTGVGFRF
jgi:opacity protein-like surface antigen